MNTLRRFAEGAALVGFVLLCVLTLEDIRACLAFAADRERRLYTAPAA